MTNLFKVEGQTLTPVEIYPAVSDTVNYLTFAFMFSYDWAGLTKSAIFTKGTDVYEVVLTNDEVLESDHVNLTAGTWSISVVGDTVVDAVVTRQITTNSYEFTVTQSSATSGGVFPPSVASQVYINTNQETPQRFVGGIPKLAVDRVIADDNDLVDKKHVAVVVAAVTADDFDHNDLANKQGGTTNEYYHVTAAEKTVIQNTSGTNTGDQDVSGAISTHNSDAGAHADKESKSNKVTSLSGASTDTEYPSAKAVFRRLQNKNGLDDGLDLSTIFSNAAEFHTAISTGDFSKIRVGDYWPISLTGSFRDVSSYTVPSGITYYSNSELTTPAGTTSTTYEGIYYSATAISFTISSTTYYVAIDSCLAYFVRTLSNAILKLEVAAINPYINYGDTAFSVNHVLLISRDCLPVTLKMRAGNSLWYNTGATNPWLGSALYETLNNVTYGLLPLIAASNIGSYIYAGPNSNGMRWMGEVKASGVSTPTSWSWVDRGKIFLPTELEIWNQSVYTNHSYCMGLNNQIDIFKGSMRHIVKGLGNGGSRYYWWSASAYVGSATNFAFVYANGNPGGSSASTSYGVPACFLLS